MSYSTSTSTSSTETDADAGEVYADVFARGQAFAAALRGRALNQVGASAFRWQTRGFENAPAFQAFLARAQDPAAGSNRYRMCISPGIWDPRYNPIRPGSKALKTIRKSVDFYSKVVASSSIF